MTTGEEASKISDLVLTPTHAALVFANARNDVEGFKKATEEAVEELLAGFERDGGPDSVMDIFFHVFSWKGEFNLMLIPAKDKSCMFVDLCVMEEGPTVEAGPLKGKKMKMPRPFSVGEIEDE
jgi:hypothetical protein